MSLILIFSFDINSTINNEKFIGNNARSKRPSRLGGIKSLNQIPNFINGFKSKEGIGTLPDIILLIVTPLAAIKPE